MLAFKKCTKYKVKNWFFTSSLHKRTKNWQGHNIQKKWNFSSITNDHMGSLLVCLSMKSIHFHAIITVLKRNMIYDRLTQKFPFLASLVLQTNMHIYLSNSLSFLTEQKNSSNRQNIGINIIKWSIRARDQERSSNYSFKEEHDLNYY